MVALPWWANILLMCSGLAMVSFGSVYAANNAAPLMAYLAGTSVSIGGYLIGLFQEKPNGSKVASAAVAAASEAALRDVDARAAAAAAAVPPVAPAAPADLGPIPGRAP